MTQKKLEPIGPYTPEHEGPWVYVGLSIKKCDVHSAFGGVAFISVAGEEEPFTCPESHIRNAREVPVVREFWVVEHGISRHHYSTYLTKQDALYALRTCGDAYRIIHLREVLPGESE